MKTSGRYFLIQCGKGLKIKEIVEKSSRKLSSCLRRESDEKGYRRLQYQWVSRSHFSSEQKERRKLNEMVLGKNFILLNGKTFKTKCSKWKTRAKQWQFYEAKTGKIETSNGLNGFHPFNQKILDEEILNEFISFQLSKPIENPKRHEIWQNEFQGKKRIEKAFRQYQKRIESFKKDLGNSSSQSYPLFEERVSQMLEIDEKQSLKKDEKSEKETKCPRGRNFFCQIEKGEKGTDRKDLVKNSQQKISLASRLECSEHDYRILHYQWRCVPKLNEIFQRMTTEVTKVTDQKKRKRFSFEFHQFYQTQKTKEWAKKSIRWSEYDQFQVDRNKNQNGFFCGSNLSDGVELEKERAKRFQVDSVYSSKVIERKIQKESEAKIWYEKFDGKKRIQQSKIQYDRIKTKKGLKKFNLSEELKQWKDELNQRRKRNQSQLNQKRKRKQPLIELMKKSLKKDSNEKKR